MWRTDLPYPLREERREVAQISPGISFRDKAAHQTTKLLPLAKVNNTAQHRDRRTGSIASVSPSQGSSNETVLSGEAAEPGASATGTVESSAVTGERVT